MRIESRDDFERWLRVAEVPAARYVREQTGIPPAFLALFGERARYAGGKLDRRQWKTPALRAAIRVLELCRIARRRVDAGARAYELIALGAELASVAEDFRRREGKKTRPPKRRSALSDDDCARALHKHRGNYKLAAGKLGLSVRRLEQRIPKSGSP